MADFLQENLPFEKSSHEFCKALLKHRNKLFGNKNLVSFSLIFFVLHAAIIYPIAFVQAYADRDFRPP